MKTIVNLVVAVVAFGAVVTPQITKADPPTMPEKPSMQKPGVVVRYTGTVKPIEVDTCMDGATFILTQSAGGQETKMRLKPANDDVKKILNEAVVTGAQVTAVGSMGSMIPQCSYLEVKSAELAKIVADKSP